MNRTHALLTLSLSLSFTAGCHRDVPSTSIGDSKTNATAQPTNEHPDPDNRDCAAIKDAARAEDCRLWKSVEAAGKKHNSDNVVKRRPGSIQQP